MNLCPTVLFMKTSLPGIKFIGYLPCKDLPLFILQKHLAGIPVSIYSTATPVDFFTNASCEATQEHDNGVVLEKTILQFSTTLNLPYGIPLAFVVKDVNDKTYVIGTHEAPFPTITSDSFISEEKNIHEFKIQLNSRKTLIPCYF